MFTSSNSRSRVKDHTKLCKASGEVEMSNFTRTFTQH
jgi:hypothetical protein